MFAKAYYLEPEGQAAKPYVLLRDALQDADRVAIVKIALRQREQLATLRVRDDVLVLNTMLWPDEVRGVDFGFLDEDIETRPAELAMASSLIDSMAGSFKPDEFTDNYRAALQEVIDAKVEGREVVAPEETEEAPAAAVDLMAALKASVERAKKARGEAPEERAQRDRGHADHGGQVHRQEGGSGEEDHGEEGHPGEEDRGQVDEYGEEGHAGQEGGEEVRLTKVARGIDVG